MTNPFCDKWYRRKSELFLSARSPSVSRKWVAWSSWLPQFFNERFCCRITVWDLQYSVNRFGVCISTRLCFVCDCFMRSSIQNWKSLIVQKSIILDGTANSHGPTCAKIGNMFRNTFKVRFVFTVIESGSLSAPTETGFDQMIVPSLLTFGYSVK